MSTQNYFLDFKEIPIVKFDHYYLMNENGDILHFKDELRKRFEIVYTFNSDTFFKPLEMFNYADNAKVYLIPAEIYMVTFCGYLPFKIDYRVKEDASTYYYEIPSKTKISDTEIMLGDVPFKKSNLIIRGHIYVSSRGCIYDNVSHSIVRHKFKDKMYNYRRYSSFKIHQLVYDAWIGPIDENKEIHHIDNNDWNNDKSNLVQLTRSEHMNLHGARSYSDELLHKICKMLSEGGRITEIAEEMDVPVSIVRELHAHRAHTDITSQYTFPEYINRGSAKASDETIHEICKLLEEHKLNNAEIGKKYDMNKYTIQDIRRGVGWKRIANNYRFIREIDLNSNVKKEPVNISEYKAPNQSITVDQVKEIWRRLQRNESMKFISEDMEVSYSIVTKIKYRARWTHITDQLGPLPGDECKENIVQ